MKHIVTDIQRFCMHDGFGVRTTVFLKGCPLNCFWCHNPETKKAAPQIMYHQSKCIGCGSCNFCKNHVFTPEHRLLMKNCKACGKCVSLCPASALTMAGKEMSTEEIINEVLKDTVFYQGGGGMTLSGGEPMLYPEKCMEILKAAKSAGINTAVETCGYFDEKYVKPLCDNADLLLWDIKDTDSDRHLKNTGVRNEKILNNLFLADEFNVPIILRCILLKGINFNDEHLSEVKKIYKSLKNAVRIDFLPCHSLGNSKNQALLSDILDLTPYEPAKEDVEYANAFVNG